MISTEKLLDTPDTRRKQIAVGNSLYFDAYDRNTGDVELYKSNGTALGTVLVKNIHPTDSSSPTLLTNVGGTLFFAANTQSNGLELFRSDGTNAGTVMVADINAGTRDANPTELTAVNNSLYFAASTLTNVNLALVNAVFNPLNTEFNGPATITISSNDQGGTGAGSALTTISTVTVNVTGVNDPPVVTIPAASSIDEDTQVTFSTANSNLISIADPDAFNAVIQATLIGVNGSLTINSVTQASFVLNDTAGQPI